MFVEDEKDYIMRMIKQVVPDGLKRAAQAAGYGNIADFFLGE